MSKKHDTDISLIQSRQDAFCLHQSKQVVYHQILQLTFMNAVHLVDARAKLHYPNLIRVLKNAIEAYDMAKLELNDLAKGKRSINLKTDWLDPKWYDLTHEDFFNALEPETQRELLNQGYKHEK